MNTWQISDIKKLSGITTSENLEKIDDIKVKTTKCFITLNDLYSFNGEIKREFPFTPCSIAIGQVIETSKDSIYLSKGSKVFLSPTFTKEAQTGYLRDFVVLPEHEVYVLPESVDEKDAIYLNHIALALTVIDKLNIEKGNHVAILGGSYLGNIIAQLLMYYQSVPILIDNDSENLEVAHKTNVYYTLKNNKNLENEILGITGGRKCSKIIYCNDSTISVDTVDKISANGADVCVTGISVTKSRLSCSFAYDKELNFIFIKDGAQNIASSINLLAQKAITLNYFNPPLYKFEYAPKHFENALIKLEEKEENPEFFIDML